MDNAIVQAHIKAAKMTMELVAASGGDFSPMIVPFRQGQPIVSITPPAGDGHTILRIGQLATEGYRADDIIACIDTYTAGELFNPYTMQPWLPGDMEDLALNHKGVERGWVLDALTVVFVQRMGPPAMYTLPYSRSETGVTWLEERARSGDEDSQWQAAGPLTRMMEPIGVFTGLDSPSDELVNRFLTKIGATVEVW